MQRRQKVKDVCWNVKPQRAAERKGELHRKGDYIYAKCLINFHNNSSEISSLHLLSTIKRAFITLLKITGVGSVLCLIDC